MTNREITNGVIAGVAFATVLALVVIAGLKDMYPRVDPLDRDRCTLVAKEFTGDSRKVGTLPREYETVNRYQCDKGEKNRLVVTWGDRN